MRTFSYSITGLGTHRNHRKKAFVNTFRPRQNGCHLADDIFKCRFMKEKYCVLIRDSLEFVPKCPFGKKMSLVQVMACRSIGNKQLPELMMHPYMRHLF